MMATMTKDDDEREQVRVAFRWDARLVDRIDAYAERVRADMPGLAFTRTEAVRVLLEKALATVEAEQGAKRARKG